MVKNGRIGHALTFAGEEGSANLALGIAFAQFMCCTNKQENDSCGVCPSCLKFEKNSHPDVHYYFPATTTKEVPKNPLSYKFYQKWRAYLSENMFVTYESWLETLDSSKKSASILVEESLQIIRDLTLKSYEADYRFAIIWLPETMNISSANKLLKIIEEPPNQVYFFLITEKPELILPTITSRTQTIRIGKMKSEEIKEWIKTKEPSLGESEIQAIVKTADGNPLRALKSIGNELFDFELTESFIAWARLCYKAYEQMPALINFSEKLAVQKREDQKEFLEYGIEFFRSSLILNSKTDGILYNFPEELKHLKNFAPLLNMQNSPTLIQVFENGIRHLERNANTKVLFMDLSLQFAKNLNAKNVNL